MAETSTGLLIVQHAVERGGLGLYLPNADIGSIAAGSVTSVKWLRDGNFATNTFRSMGAHIWRPSNATGVADDWRSASDLTASTGALSIDANWADTTLTSEDFIILFHNNHYDYLIAAMNRALRRAYYQTQEPLSKKPSGAVLADAGFQKSATTQWTESDADAGAATTFSKVATQNSENVFANMTRSGRVLNSADLGYIRQRYSVSSQSQLNAFSLTRLDAGTNAQLVLWDVTNDAEIGTLVEHSQEAWQFMRRLGESVPATCKIVEIRHRGEGASADFYINGSWIYETQGRRIILDTEWDTSFKAPKLMYTEMGGQSVSSNVFDGQSMRLRPVPADDYSATWNRTAANPGSIQFHTDEWFKYPLWIDGRRAHSDVDGPFTRVLTETTSADLDLIVWLTLEELFSDTRVKHPEKQSMLGLAISRVASLTLQFPFESPARTNTPASWGRVHN
jgi:hypothetical protein